MRKNKAASKMKAAFRSVIIRSLQMLLTAPGRLAIDLLSEMLEARMIGVGLHPHLQP